MEQIDVGKAVAEMMPEAESPHPKVAQQHVADALPNPEPAVPSLAEPDPGVFHHEPGGASDQEVARKSTSRTT